jgi:hypothetical protein
MKKIDLFSKRILVVCAGVCMILVTNALLPSSDAKATSKKMMSSSNTISMGIDNGFAYYLFIPDGGNWSFEKIPVTKAKTATW